jgi:hypothetical protein
VHRLDCEPLAIRRTIAVPAYEAACKRWPGEAITLRQGSRVIEDSRKKRLA